jgi:DHA1 family tetracycline resistance protein-like MFS transporter
MRPARVKTHPALYPVMLTYFLDTFGLSMVYPIFSPLFLKPELGLLTGQESFLYRTLLLGFLIAFFPLAQFFGAPLIGEFSDRFGRKRAFFITILGTGIGYCLTALGILLKFLPLLFISRFWTGFFAGNLTICLAAIADMSQDEESRTKNFGLLGAIAGTSFITGIIFAGDLSHPQLHPILGLSFPFWTIACLSLLNLILMIFLFHESHPTKTKFSINLLKGAHNILLAMKMKKNRMIYLAYFSFMMCWVTSMQFLPTFLIKNFAVDPVLITQAFIGIGLIWSLSNFAINPLIARFLHPPKVLIFSLFLLSALLFLSLAPETLFLFLILFLGATFFGALCWTNSLATVSLCTPTEHQGSILGINQSFGAIASIIGPAIGGLVAGHGAHFIYVFTGAVSLLSATFLFIGRKDFPPLLYKK